MQHIKPARASTAETPSSSESSLRGSSVFGAVPITKCIMSHMGKQSVQMYKLQFKMNKQIATETYKHTQNRTPHIYICIKSDAQSKPDPTD